VTDPETGELISDAEVAEIDYTAFAGTTERITARLIVRRVRDRNHPDELFPVWRYHPFFTNNTEPVTAADITHRQHAIIESVFADLIDGPLAHLPSGSFPANNAWTVLAAITHNLLRAADTLAGRAHAVARGAHSAPASGERPGPNRPAPNKPCTYPLTGPGPTTGKPCGTASSSTAADKSWTETLTTRPKSHSRKRQWTRWARQQVNHARCQFHTPGHSAEPNQDQQVS
jgi:hypothetical protein